LEAFVKAYINMKAALTYSAKYPYVREWTRRTLANRAHHHGYQHAIEVATLSAKIGRKLLPPLGVNLTRIVGILHDVGDYKVATGDDQLRLSDMLLRTGGPATRSLILNIIERVSFMREMRVGSEDWDSVLGDAVVIRNIVSDADKLMSLGVRGHKRLLLYNVETQGDVLGAMDKVINDRLMRVPSFMRTEYGRKHAPAALDELLNFHHAFVRGASKFITV
jgi:hypothetical protein